jgi:HEAT repeat protein
MNTQVISEIYRIHDCTEDFPDSNISSLIEHLSDSDGSTRMLAREALSCIGSPAVAELIQALYAANVQLRWEIIKVLECIQDPTTIPILVEQLRDEHAGIRWAAANALIGSKRDAIPAIMNALVHDFDSLALRQSAHHILHVLKDDGKLTDAELKVYEALQEVEPSASVPWAAIKALESLRNSTK